MAADTFWLVPGGWGIHPALAAVLAVLQAVAVTFPDFREALGRPE